jgi:hypothetical protein
MLQFQPSRESVTRRHLSSLHLLDSTLAWPGQTRKDACDWPQYHEDGVDERFLHPLAHLYFFRNCLLCFRSQFSSASCASLFAARIPLTALWALYRMLLLVVDSLLRFALRLRNHYTYTTSASMPGMIFARNPPALAVSARIFTTATIDPPNHPTGVARGARQAGRFACCVLLGCVMVIPP